MKQHLFLKGNYRAAADGPGSETQSSCPLSRTQPRLRREAQSVWVQILFERVGFQRHLITDECSNYWLLAAWKADELNTYTGITEMFQNFLWQMCSTAWVTQRDIFITYINDTYDYRRLLAYTLKFYNIKNQVQVCPTLGDMISKSKQMY